MHLPIEEDVYQIEHSRSVGLMRRHIPHLADSMNSAREILAAANKSGKIFAVIQNRRYQAEILALRQFLDSGEIGAISMGHCDFFIGAHFGGFRGCMQNVLLPDMAIRTFDRARLITPGVMVAVIPVMCIYPFFQKYFVKDVLLGAVKA